MRVLIRMLFSSGSPRSLWAQAEERTIYVSVVDKSDKPVSGLSAGEFIVREDDVSREVLRASAATEPLQIALLIDTSQAIEPYMLDLRNALRAFFKQMAGKHEIALIGVGERPTVLVDYTRDVARLEKGLGRRVRAQRQRHLFDGRDDGGRRRIAETQSESPNHGSVVARGPEFSERHHDNVLERLREAGVVLHSLVLTKPGAMRMDRAEQELDMSIAEGTKTPAGAARIC